MGFMETDSKVRAFASKKGIDVGDALAVGRWFDDGRWVVWVVRSSLIEEHTLPKVGAMSRKGAGVRTLAVGRVGGVSATHRGVTGVLTVEGQGESLVYRGDVDTRDRLEVGVRAAMAGVGATVPARPAVPPPAVPAGWYPAGGVQRYWDGSAWTEHTAPLS